MKQIYSPYWLWEDYINGMYASVDVDNKEVMINRAVIVLSDTTLFNDILLIVTKEWPVSTAVNLSNIKINRRAWLGQAACSYHSKTPEILTREAWKRLTNIQRHHANEIAHKHILLYERRNTKIYSPLGIDGLS